MLIELLSQVQSEDLVILGMRAASVRTEVHTHHIVGYTSEVSTSPRMTLQSGSDLIESVSRWNPQGPSLIPLCASGMTATDYLRLIAVCRLLHPALHIEVDLTVSGLKIGQLALGFGADDLGSINTKPSIRTDEEEIRRTIRDAGFHPKRRSANYDYYWID